MYPQTHMERYQARTSIDCAPLEPDSSVNRSHFLPLASSTAPSRNTFRSFATDLSVSSDLQIIQLPRHLIYSLCLVHPTTAGPGGADNRRYVNSEYLASVQCPRSMHQATHEQNPQLTCIHHSKVRVRARMHLRPPRHHPKPSTNAYSSFGVNWHRGLRQRVGMK
jgi:hypothetical protein